MSHNPDTPDILDFQTLTRWAKANELVITRMDNGYSMAGEYFADGDEVLDWFAEHRAVWYWKRMVRNLKGALTMMDTALAQLRKGAELPHADVAQRIAEAEASRAMAEMLLDAARTDLLKAETAEETKS